MGNVIECGTDPSSDAPPVSSYLLSASPDVRVLGAPEGKGKGFLAGAPGAALDPATGEWYVCCRLRRPRDHPDGDRGAAFYIMKDGVEVWRVKKQELGAASIERGALLFDADGQWKLYLSVVTESDKLWRLVELAAPRVEALAAADATVVFTADMLGPNVQGVKDPFIFAHGGALHMFLSVALSTADTSAASHATLDIYNTGECVSATALATRAAGDAAASWKYEGVVFEPAPGAMAVKPQCAWDAYCRRVNSVIAHGGRFWAFYDGIPGAADNYEEKTGVAVSADLRAWRCLTPAAPVFASPFASGALRYVEAREVGGTVHLFYEMARPDGAHELRTLALAPRQLYDALDAVAGIDDDARKGAPSS
jgi:hypothetical protein